MRRAPLAITSGACRYSWTPNTGADGVEVGDGKSDLEQELDRARRSISTDSYPMSIGEITSLYRDGELIIRPAFQRLYRWDNDQKSRLIESILLGIPIPSIFVSQDDEGKWEVVDGLQRLSTLFQLQGLLDTEKFPPLILEETKFLPSLAGKSWNDTSNNPLSDAQKRDIKRAKIDIKIIKRSSDSRAKFDLFQRLNSFGTALSNQEIRNALLVGVNVDFVEWLQGLATNANFVELTKLSEREVNTKYDEELVLRFLWLHRLEEPVNEHLKNFQDGLEAASLDMAEGFPTGKPELEDAFIRTFDLLKGSPDVFRKWDAAGSRPTGGFLNTSFEVIALGLGYRIAQGLPHRTDFNEVVKDLWSQGDMQGGFATGKSTERRLQIMVPKGRELLAPRSE